MPRKGFLSAYDAGRRFVTKQLYWSNKNEQYKVCPQSSQDEPIENVVFEAMEVNPYKTEEKRKDFLAGVTFQMESSARLQTRKMVYG